MRWRQEGKDGDRTEKVEIEWIRWKQEGYDGDRWEKMELEWAERQEKGNGEWKSSSLEVAKWPAIIKLAINLTSAVLNTPLLCSTEKNDSMSVVLATGSMPLLMISRIQSQVLSLSNGNDMKRSSTETNFSLAIRLMSIQAT